jgi:hypothetical protein
VPTTRSELARHIHAAFVHPPATRATVLAYASGSHARRAVIDLLGTLPDKTYPTIADLWQELGHVPAR